MLQVTVRLTAPGQDRPPLAGVGFVQVRVSDNVPEPQGTEQELDAAQADQPPSTTINFFISIISQLSKLDVNETVNFNTRACFSVAS